MSYGCTKNRIYYPCNRDDFCCRFAAANAIRNSGAAISVAGERQAGQFGDELFDLAHSIEMAHFVLRHRSFPLRHFSEQRSSVDTQQLAKISFDSRRHLCLVERKDLGLQRAARKRAQQHVIVRRAPGKFHAAERARDQRSLLDKRHNKAESIQRMSDSCAPVTEVDRCS